MPPFAGDQIGARQDMTVHDDPTPDSRAQDDAEHDVGARGRAVGRLRDGEAVRVVHEPHGTVEPRFQIASQRPAVEPDGVGVLHEPGLRHERPRNADAHRAGLAGRTVELPHQARDGVEQRPVIGGRGHASPGDLLTRRRQRDGCDLRRPPR